ncbi:hypothetical protein COV18_05860 [Candidatus Woesearchaeota archaeon CG10_big_fil_rev_8_21_14_0_10_37_12]|nr:MAG: hypothetical protein COV18_05860 [Candidatus Woesearchaeota archaeon CG10_big_fil_rev_8_21_14_0_10_37_12]
MAKRKSKRSKSRNIVASAAKTTKTDTKSRVYAFLGTLLPVIGWIISYFACKEDKYASYYGRQGTWLLVCAVVLHFVLIFSIIGIALIPLLWVIAVILWVIGIINALSGKTRPIPITGRFAEKLKL